MVNKQKQKVVKIYKQIGETPLESINKFKKDFPEYKDSKFAYAGRLDPLAHGELVLLVDDECKNRDKYQNLDKEYTFEILFGFATDTFDLMGLITDSYLKKIDILTVKNTIQKFFDNVVAQLNFEQEYPVYSSKAVNGKPLFWWAREGRLNEISIPTKNVKLYSSIIQSSYAIKSKDLLNEIHSRIEKVKGDFRQQEILEKWDSLLKNSDETFSILKINVKVSSGTYVRGLVNSLSKELGVPAVAFDIKRERVIINDEL